MSTYIPKSKLPEDYYSKPSPNYVFEEPNKWRTGNKPERILLNPLIPPCEDIKKCDIRQKIAFSEWLVKEYAVLQEEIVLYQRELKTCFLKYAKTAVISPNREDKCKLILMKTHELLTRKKEIEQLEMLKQGKRVVAGYKE